MSSTVMQSKALAAKSRTACTYTYGSASREYGSPDRPLVESSAAKPFARKTDIVGRHDTAS